MRVSRGKAAAIATACVAIPVIGFAIWPFVLEEWHLRSLEVGDLNAKARSASWLAERGCVRAIPAIARLYREQEAGLEETDSPVPFADALRKLAVPRAIPDLIRLLEADLSHPDQIVEWAASRLADLAPGRPEVLDAVEQLLNHRLVEVRVAAVEGLRTFGPAAIAPLTLALHDGDESIVVAAAKALCDAGKAAAPAVPVLRDVLRRSSDDFVRQHVLLALAAAESDVAAELSALLEGHESPIRAWALERLAEMGGDAAGAADAIARALTDEATDVAQEAFRALCAMGPAAARTGPALLAYSRRRDVRAPIFLACITDLGEVAVPLCLESLRSGDDSSAYFALGVLARLGRAAATAVPALIQELENGDAVNAAEAARALGTIGGVSRSAIPALERTLRRAEPILRLRAAGALLLLGSGGGVALAVLLSGLDSDDYLERITAIEGLGALGPRAAFAVPRLAAAMKDDATCVAALSGLLQVGPAALPALREALSGDDATFWLKIIRDAGPAGRTAVPILMDLLRDEELAPLAAEALLAVGPDPRVPDSLACYAAKALNMDESIESFAKWGAVALGCFEKSLDDADAGVRRDAVLGLAQMGPSANGAVASLERLLDDPDWDVRLRAAQALLLVDLSSRSSRAVWRHLASDPLSPRPKWVKVRIRNFPAQADPARPYLVHWSGAAELTEL